MTAPQPRLHLLCRGLSGTAEPGHTLHEAVRRLGHVLDGACGGGALCGDCCVLVCEGEAALTPPDPLERDRLRQMGLSSPCRLACRARVAGHEGEIVLVAC